MWPRERPGLVERVVPFGENPASSKRAVYRICDACHDLWFRFVMPPTSAVEGGRADAHLVTLEDMYQNR